MVGRHIYTCRTLENLLRVVICGLAVYAVFESDGWVNGYFRRAGMVGPFVHGKCVAFVMAHTLTLLLHPAVLLLALPSLGQWLFLHVETSRDELRYAVPRWFQVDRGRVGWDRVMPLYESRKELRVKAGDFAFSLPVHLSHYKELVREIRERSPRSRTTEIAGEWELWDRETLDPAVLEQVHAHIREGHTTKAVTALRQDTTLDLKTAVDYVDQWAEDNGFGLLSRPDTSSRRSWLLWPALYAGFVLWNLYG